MRFIKKHTNSLIWTQAKASVSKMKLNLVVTGASGFIGAATVKELLARNHNVAALVRCDSNSYRLDHCDGLKKITYLQFCDSKTVVELMAFEPDVFIHCGWRGVSGKDRNEPFQLRDNLQMSLQSVELAAAAGCYKWIGLGSQAEYGNQNQRLDETSATLPTTLYGKAKLATGIACLALAETLGISAAWLRVFSTYGPGDAPNWLLQYALREFEAGRSPRLTTCTQLWDYLHVSDAARAISSAAESKGAVGTFNLGSGTARSLRYWVDLLRESIGSKIEPEYGIIPFRPDQVMHLEADISRITAKTGWKPMMSPEEGIATLLPTNRISSFGKLI